MNPEEERLAEALVVERMYGELATAFVAERIGALALAGDAAGVSKITFFACAPAVDLIVFLRATSDRPTGPPGRFPANKEGWRRLVRA